MAWTACPHSSSSIPAGLSACRVWSQPERVSKVVEPLTVILSPGSYGTGRDEVIDFVCWLECWQLGRRRVRYQDQIAVNYLSGGRGRREIMTVKRYGL